MKAVVYTQYGPPEVLRLADLDRPAPRENEVLIQVHATTVTAEDCIFRKGRPLAARSATGLLRPKYPTLGTDLAGVVVAAGAKVTRFREGDEVWGATGAEFGSYAEYICLPEDGAIAPKPNTLNFAEAAAVCGGILTAFPFLRDTAKLERGQQILIIGASGSVGTAAVQLAKHLGAEVTGVCSTGNLELVRSLGADAVIDYTREDFTQDGRTYDVIFDAVGKNSFSRCKGSLKPRGIYLSTVISAGILFHTLWTSKRGSKRGVIAFTGLRPPSEKAADLLLVKELCEAGSYTPVIDRHYPLEHIVEAHRYVDQGHKKGSVVLTVAPGEAG